MDVPAHENAADGRAESARTGAAAGARKEQAAALTRAEAARRAAQRAAAKKVKAEGRRPSGRNSEGTWPSNGRTRRENANNRGSGQRGNGKAVKFFAPKIRCGIVLRGGILQEAGGRGTLSPLPAIFRIRGFDTGRGLGVNSAEPQDLGGGYLLLLHLILFLYSYSYKV